MADELGNEVTTPITEAYRERDKTLKAIGFNDYREYLKSDLWHAIRDAAFASSRACQLCGQPASCVHHRDYSEKTLRGRNRDGLIRLCDGCHHFAEFKLSDGPNAHRLQRKGIKCSLEEANDRIAFVRSVVLTLIEQLRRNRYDLIDAVQEGV